MKIIVGLGNPGAEYEKTRHNLGYMAIDKLASELGVNIDKKRLLGLTATCKIGREKAILVKPLTYMNLSGDCVAKIMNYYKETPENVIVIYDDIDIDVGKIRVKPSGSPGTHNGMKDITAKIGSQTFPRVRIGSGKPIKGQDLADFVLSKVKKEEKELIDKATDMAKDAVLDIVQEGISTAMNKYN
jgi:PTH1 family peptidyl-tRNA hydrolase